MHHPSPSERPGGAPTPGQEIIPLEPTQREQYPQVIYEWTWTSPVESMVFNASVVAAQEAGLPLVLDRTIHPQHGQQAIVVRTATTNRHQLTTEAALIQGLTGAVEEALHEDSGYTGPVIADPFERALSVARRDLNQIVDNPDLLQKFKEYYGGLMWGTDQEKFIRALFVHSAQYDPDLLDAQLTSDDVTSLVYSLDLDIPYEERRDWHKKTPTEIFATKPELDYRQLADPAFRETADGQKLYEAYRRLCGERQAQAYQAHPQPITEQGTFQPRPLIPLRAFPIIESITADLMSQSAPRAKYSFGPSDVAEMVVHSDSPRALRSLVVSVANRPPEEDRHVFDGPTEFQHQRGVIRAVLDEYEHAYDIPERREPLKQALLAILTAYTHGGVAQEVLGEYYQRDPERRSWYRETGEVKQIIADILTVATASPDANDFIAASTMGVGTEITTRTPEGNILLPTQKDMQIIVLDALKRLTPQSNARVMQRLAAQAFGDSSSAARIGRIAELKIAAATIRRSPEALLAVKGLRRFGYSLDNKPNPEKEQAEQQHAEAIAPAEEFSHQARAALNTFLLDRMDLLARSGGLQNDDRESIALFKALVQRVHLTERDNEHQLSDTYKQLVELAHKETLTDHQRADICWHIAEQFKYATNDLRPVLPEVVLDMYRIALGPVHSIRIPGNETSHMLAAASLIARNNNVFAHATEDQLLALARYGVEVSKMGKLANEGRLLAAVPQHPDQKHAKEYEQIIREIEHTERELGDIEDLYRQYLHISEVRRDPTVYFPWLTGKLLPFWQKMQWEVGPGNRPTAEIQGLHKHLESFLTNLKPTYPENFDYLQEGKLGDFLVGCYERMVVPHDIKYNTTVWQEGLTFMHYAVAYMPPALFGEFKARYPKHETFLTYLQNEWARWHDEIEGADQ